MSGCKRRALRRLLCSLKRNTDRPLSGIGSPYAHRVEERGRPAPALRRQDALDAQFGCHLVQAQSALLHFGDGRCYPGCKRICLGAFPGGTQTAVWNRATTVAPKLLPCRGGCQGHCGTVRYGLPLSLGDYRHDAHRQLIGLRHVGSDERHIGALQTEQEVCVTAQPVELGDHQLRSGQPAHSKRAG